MTEYRGMPKGTNRSARGVVLIHTCSKAMSAHVKWAMERVLGRDVNIDFTDQPLAEGMLRAEVPWTGSSGSAARLASELRAFPGVRFDVTEDPLPGIDGERYSCTPSLGIYRATIAANGDVLVSELQIRELLGRAAAASIIGDEFDFETELELLMGRPWDDELEPLRHAGDGAPIRWLNQVG